VAAPETKKSLEVSVGLRLRGGDTFDVLRGFAGDSLAALRVAAGRTGAARIDREHVGLVGRLNMPPRVNGPAVPRGLRAIAAGRKS
jgi:hypothetical protein